jgi:light-harvesting complex 1 beta chain
MDVAAVVVKQSPVEGPWAFTGIFVAAFLVFLPIALVAQALGVSWRDWFPGAETERSLVGGVRTAVYSVMSYLI